ncbi:MAG: hypothetical protein DME97_07180 [Verrucomicrobia bacterium]|nr:MAG: hypothetical protein DME97_07180 [Verrucomicrobiota bacterium]
MKKHLFYTVLVIFIVTSAITLAGTVRLLPIEEKYLDKLIWAFLLQLAAAIFSVFRKANFFTEEEKARLESVEVAIAQTRPAAQRTLLDPPPGMPKPVKTIDVAATGYFENLARLQDRPLERDTWLRDVNGKEVTWVGVFADINAQLETGGVQLQLHPTSSTNATFFVFAPAALRDFAYSLRKGDRVRARGVINCSVLSRSPYITASLLERAD